MLTHASRRYKPEALMERVARGACKGRDGEISYEPSEGDHENPAATLPMPEVPMGFHRPKEAVLPRVWHVAADRVGFTLRCRAHRNQEFLDVGAWKGKVALHPGLGRA